MFFEFWRPFQCGWRCPSNLDDARGRRAQCWHNLKEIWAISKQSELGFGSCPTNLPLLPCRFVCLAGQTKLLQLAGFLVCQLSEHELVAISPCQEIWLAYPFFAATAFADHVSRAEGGRSFKCPNPRRQYSAAADFLAMRSLAEQGEFYLSQSGDDVEVWTSSFSMKAQDRTALELALCQSQDGTAATSMNVSSTRAAAARGQFDGGRIERLSECATAEAEANPIALGIVVEFQARHDDLPRSEGELRVFTRAPVHAEGACESVEPDRENGTQSAAHAPAIWPQCKRHNVSEMCQISEVGQRDRKRESPDGLGSLKLAASQDPRTTKSGQLQVVLQNRRSPSPTRICGQLPVRTVPTGCDPLWILWAKS